MNNLNFINENIELNNALSLNDIMNDIIASNPVESYNIQYSSNNYVDKLLGYDEEECTALVPVKPNSLWVAQTMFRKSVKISIKSFLISLSLGFLNLFI